VTRRLGPWSAGALVVANMIGSGAFTISGFALADLGSPALVLLAWALGGVLAAFGALSYGALGRRLPRSGGEYTVLAQLVHPFAGFLAGWLSLLAGFTAPIAAGALGLQAYFDAALGRPSGGAPWVGALAIVASALAHGARVGLGVALQNAGVALKLAGIAAFVAIGAAHAGQATAELLAPPARIDLGALATTVVWVSFAYSGWNAAIYVASELRDPGRNLTRSLAGATALVTVAYLALNAVFLAAAPPEALAGKAEVGAVAAEALGGAGLRRALAGLVALALLTSISSMLMAGPRVYAQMAEDGMLPAFLRARGDVPRAAIALQAALALVVTASSGLAALFGYAGFLLSASAAATVLVLMRLRRREGAERVPLPGWPWLPGAFVAVTFAVAAMMAVREPVVAGLGLLTVAAGVPVYWLAGGARSAVLRAEEER
jgi:APA family basic amino acid/polyamine antiporter